jgi:hypothetical protein
MANLGFSRQESPARGETIETPRQETNVNPLGRASLDFFNKISAIGFGKINSGPDNFF